LPAGFGAITLVLIELVIFTNNLSFPPDDRTILVGFFALTAAALFAAAHRGALTTSQTNALLVLLLLTELGNSSQYRLLDRAQPGQTQWLDKLRGNADIGAYLHKQPGFQRAEVANDAFAENWGVWHGVEMHGGSAASVVVHMIDSEFFGINGRRMLGVAYTIAAAPTADSGEQVFQGASGMKVYRRDAFPRAWVVHDLVQVADISQGNGEIGRDPASFKFKAYMVGPGPKLAGCAATGSADLTLHQPDRLTIQATMPCDGMVVLSDAFFPGWRARVDGERAEIYEVNGAMRGVLVPKGLHTVTMRYRPFTVYLGAALSLLGVLGAVAVAFVRHRE
jgi:hypothetical protein